MSSKFTMGSEDWQKWGINFLRFVVAPSVVAYVVALQGGVSWDVAWGVALGTLYTSIIDFIRKWSAGV